MKIVVLKISGKALKEFTTNIRYVNFLEKLKKYYDGVVIVHGAGNLISEWSAKLNVEKEFINGQRKTTKDVMDVVAAVQSGLVNNKLTGFLNSNGLEAIGLTGIDRGFFTAEYFNDKLGFVGKPKLTGSTKWITKILKENVIPVFSSVSVDESGNLMNVNADIFTKEIAIALKADTVLFVSDVDAIEIEGKAMNKISDAEIIKGIENGNITDGMIPKLESSLELLNNAIRKVWVGNKLTELRIGSSGIKNFNGTWIIKS